MAYAAVTSLMETLSLHFLQSQPRLPLDNNQKMVSLHENLRFLQESLEESSEIGYDNAGAMKDLEVEIRDVLFKAEERIEKELSNIYLQQRSHMYFQQRYMNLQPSSKMACPRRLNGITHQAVKQTDYLKKKLIKIKSEHQVTKASSIPGEMQRRGLLLGSTSSQPDLESENLTVVSKLSKNASKFDSRMVGCDEEFMVILDQLTRQSAKQRQVVSIVGMGGIGKTTLARKVYEDPSITSHFYIRAWVTVSQEYNVEKILRCLIGCVSGSSDEVHDQLAESVYKRLKGERYLIVIDDLWSTDAWDRVQRCFPEDYNGSRIVLTSRLNEVVEYASLGNAPLNKRFLDADESWNLYCKVFGKTEFHFEFEQIGRDIVKKCEGLPLAIIVVASLLSKTKEEERWKNVAQNVSRFVMGDSDDACSRILSLSYNQLPYHLKACFLYFGVFPEDYEIPVKKLVRLWTAEGFLRAVEHDYQEEVAMECLQDLIDRSLVLVSKQSYNGKIKAIKMHDLLRDLCLREARHENLLKVIGNDYHDAVGLEKLPFYKWISQRLFSKPCRWLSIRSGCFNNLISSMHFHKFYSLHCVDYGDVNLKTFSVFKLVRVVDMEIEISRGGVDILQKVLENLVHLRYFVLSSVSKSSSRCGALSIMHWNLQSFIIHGGVGVLWTGFDIWNVPLLRNLYLYGIYLSKCSDYVHRNLETMYWLKVECCTKDLFTMIPNLKKLGIDGRRNSNDPGCFNAFVDLGQLEKLSIRHLHNLSLSCSGTTWATNFLPNLKKLNFFETMVPWSDIKLIGMLPNLEVLKLIKACQGLEWEPSEGGFCRLKRLVIGYTNLKHWNATGNHFPVLECLEIESCNLLQEIPSGFADITTLALIQLNDCWDSLLASAKWIRDEQHNYGNVAFLVRSRNIKPKSSHKFNEGWDEY